MRVGLDSHHAECICFLSGVLIDLASQLVRLFTIHPPRLASRSSTDLAQATRPDRAGNGALPNPSPDMWFDVGAFPIVPDSAFRYGNSGRNILDGPGTVAVNLSLCRFFQIGEKSRVQFRWETFNTTNHPHFANPGRTLGTSTFGVVTSTITGDNRTVQLGAKISF